MAAEADTMPKAATVKAIPFQPEFKGLIDSGIKTETRRSREWVRDQGGFAAGETVQTTLGQSLKILEVYEEKLGDISPESIKAEGAKDLEDFIRIWKAIHPRAGWTPDKQVVAIRFELAVPVEPEDYYIIEEEIRAYSPPSGPKFECKLPADHFISQYMACGADVSDAYPDYWFGGGLFALAVVADKKIKIVLRQGTLYTNFYMAIIGKSGLSRKSTVVDKTESMLCRVLSEFMPSVVPTEFSPEAFTEHMSNHCHAAWIRDEASGVLSLMKKDYMRGFKDSLMVLYDCRPFCRKLRTSQRKEQTEFNVDDPYLNVLFSTTDASLAANTDLNDTLSGFLARFLFFFPTGKKPRWLPLEEGTKEISTFEEEVCDKLSGIDKKMQDLKECTPMHFSPEAAEFYKEWQREREAEWIASNDGACQQIYSRLAPMVAKLGMLFELGSPDFEVSKPIRLEFIQEACRLVDSYFMPTARAIYDVVGTNAEKNVIDRITLYLKNHNGKATKREILQATKIKSADCDEYLRTMEESGVIKTRAEERKGKGRDRLWIFLQPDSNVTSVAIVSKVSNVSNVD